MFKVRGKKEIVKYLCEGQIQVRVCLCSYFQKDYRPRLLKEEKRCILPPPCTFYL